MRWPAMGCCSASAMAYTARQPHQTTTRQKGVDRCGVVYPTTADNYFAPKTGYNAPHSTCFGGGKAMVSHLFYYQLAIPTVCPSVALRNFILYQSLPSSIPY